MAEDRNMEIEIAKLKQQIEDLAGSMRYAGGDRDLIERLDRLIEVLSAAAMEEEGPDKINKLIELLAEEAEGEPDLAMDEIARSLTGIAETMRENTELLRETVERLEKVERDLEEREPPPAKSPERAVSKEPTPEKPPEEAPKRPKADVSKGVRGIDLLEEEEREKPEGPEEELERPDVTEGKTPAADIFGEEVMPEDIPKGESLDEILSEAEKLGIDTSHIREKRSTGAGGVVLPYVLGAVWLVLGVLQFLSPLEISMVTQINEFMMNNEMTGMLFSIFLMVTGIPMIFIGMQGEPEKDSAIFNVISYITGALWVLVGVIFLVFIMQGTEITEMDPMILLPSTGIMLASGMLGIFIGVSMSQGKFGI